MSALRAMAEAIRLMGWIKYFMTAFGHLGWTMLWMLTWLFIQMLATWTSEVSSKS